jgi:hypothetical protein
MKKWYLTCLITSAAMAMLTSCTYSVSMQHSVGSTDTVDEEQAASPTVSPNINIPVTPGAGLGLGK